MKGWQPIKEEIKRELRGAIADNEPLIKADREAFMYVIENLADPQVEFLRELVEMIETGLRVGRRPSLWNYAEDICRICRKSW